MHSITEFGYLAIFLLVLLQELGVPNPVTNEFVLLFSGYLAYCGVLRFWPVFLTAVAADCIGTTLLYGVFYRFGATIVRRRPRWLPLTPERLERVSARISQRQRLGIYLARLVPFLRGYASVAAGILPIRPKVFLPAVNWRARASWPSTLPKRIRFRGFYRRSAAAARSPFVPSERAPALPATWTSSTTITGTCSSGIALRAGWLARIAWQSRQMSLRGVALPG